MTKPESRDAVAGPAEPTVRPADAGRDAQTDKRRIEQRRRLDELLKGRKKTPLAWNESGNYPLTEDV